MPHDPLRRLTPGVWEGCGRLLALAVVALDVNGVELTLQGVRVMPGQDGVLTVHGPAWRHSDTGRWHPSVLLLDELSRAIADQVLAMIHDGR